jgi:hypothetical protein
MPLSPPLRYNAAAAALYLTSGYDSLPSFDQAAAASSVAQTGALAAGRAPVLNRYHVKRLGEDNASPVAGAAGQAEDAAEDALYAASHAATTQTAATLVTPHANSHAAPRARENAAPHIAVGGRELTAGKGAVSATTSSAGAVGGRERLAGKGAVSVTAGAASAIDGREVMAGKGAVAATASSAGAVAAAARDAFATGRGSALAAGGGSEAAQ